MTGKEGSIYIELAFKATIAEASLIFHSKIRQVHVRAHIHMSDRHILCKIRDATMC